MELPFYLMSHGVAWDGMISICGEALHFELRGAGDEEGIQFDIRLEEVLDAEFQRGLVSRKLSLRVRGEKALRMFPAGVSGDKVELLVVREDPTFGTGSSEAEYEQLVQNIPRGVPEHSAKGLAG